MIQKKGKLIVIIVLFFFFIYLLVFSPFNAIQTFYPESILNEHTLSEKFEKMQVQKVEKKGRYTYIVKTNKQDYVVIKEYSSIIHYNWRVYPFTKEENF
ncbi:hypothetical protein [Priestia filamentosa]|uniref:Uncharacterized protein n=2 Tax=Priestia filamentosa TaxID=1402861 RepID=A0A1X7FLI2_9BACI|nr:hypothetical protein [Priestia filamentosa]AKO91412.1 hypothetical protein BEH_04395 [Priestia filamentosa]MDT3765543.1 hypothetical protein [Priestia filamentosa]MED3728204.1 hypothetical protein [Priestia filamentosa]OXS67313.1 hypothetical protein B1B01_17650 [Priestia filamentosa]RJS65203.1 hypothetical protein CJ485_10695 [Priestia filamentosa]